MTQARFGSPYVISSSFETWIAAPKFVVPAASIVSRSAWAPL